MEDAALTPDHDREAVAGIYDAIDELRQAERKVGNAVAHAVWRGASWAEIGAALGISKQAAWERWRDVIERRDRGDFDA